MGGGQAANRTAAAVECGASATLRFTGLLSRTVCVASSLLLAASVLLTACGRHRPSPPGTPREGAAPRDGAASREGAAAAPRRPHVVVFLADDLGWNEVGYHGGAVETPTLDALAREGVRLERFYAYPICSPSRAALLTGRRPERYGLLESSLMGWEDRGLPPAEVTLAERLRDAGYETALAGKWHLGHARRRWWPQNQGFEHFYGSLLGSIDYFAHTHLGGIDWQRDGRTVQEEGYATDLVAAEAVRRIEERDPTRPLFLLVSFQAPHHPFQAPDAWLDRVPGRGGDEARVIAAMILALDHAVGDVLAALGEAGMAGESLVVFLSDNGAPGVRSRKPRFDDRLARNAPLRGGKWTVFEGGIRVPAIARWPGRIEGGRAFEGFTSILDLAPTILAAATVEPDPGHPLDGRNLLGMLGDRGAGRRDSAAPDPSGAPGPVPAAGDVLEAGELTFACRQGRDRWLALIEKGRKIVRLSGGEGEAREGLFDVLEDPGEERDLSRDRPEFLRALEERARHFEEGLSPTFHAPPAPRPRGWLAPSRWAEAARP